jgi:hypothetical protein
MRLGVDAWSLSVEASSVIALRMLKFAVGGVAAEAEARKMVSERSRQAWRSRPWRLRARLVLQQTGLRGKR